MIPSKTPRLRMFAGPNGSGKSTIKDAIPKYLLGIYLNADDIEKQIKLTAQFDLSPYRANAEDALAFFRQSSFLAKSNLLDQIDLIQVANQTLCFSQLDINSYIASVLVDFLRHHLLAKRLSFTFETVMSHQSKVDFLQEAQQQGFRTYLYFELASQIRTTALSDNLLPEGCGQHPTNGALHEQKTPSQPLA